MEINIDPMPNLNGRNFDLYVEPPWGGGNLVANYVNNGCKLLLVSSFPGMGKTTEILKAAHILKETRITVIIPPAFFDFKRISRDYILNKISGRIAYIASKCVGIDLDEDIIAHLIHGGFYPQCRDIDPCSISKISSEQLLSLVVGKVQKASGRSICLLVDALDKMPPHLFNTLKVFNYMPSSVDLVINIPHYFCYNKKCISPIVSNSEELLIFRQSRKEGYWENAEVWWKFLGETLKRRCPDLFNHISSGSDDEEELDDDLCYHLVINSQGNPGVFYDLIRKSLFQAKLRNPECEAFVIDDLETVIMSMSEKMKRAYLHYSSLDIFGGNKAVKFHQPYPTVIDLESISDDPSDPVIYKMISDSILIEQRMDNGKLVWVPNPILLYSHQRDD